MKTGCIENKEINDCCQLKWLLKVALKKCATFRGFVTFLFDRLEVNKMNELLEEAKSRIQEVFGYCCDVDEVCEIYAELLCELRKQKEFCLKEQLKEVRKQDE